MLQDICPLKTFHFGGDEVPYEAWEDSPACQSLVESGEVSAFKHLMEYFVVKVRFFKSMNNCHRLWILQTLSVCVCMCVPLYGLRFVYNGSDFVYIYELSSLSKAPPQCVCLCVCFCMCVPL